jgi:hypothetical protein
MKCATAKRSKAVPGAAWPVLIAFSLAAGGCVSESERQAEAMPPASPTDVYFYPSHGESAQQQGRDKFECNNWAAQQTGFDPSAAHLPPHLRVTAVADPNAAAGGMAIGAASGAVIGAAVSRPWEAGPGALVGALAGAAIGGITASAASEQSYRPTAGELRDAQLERLASNFRRALSACLEGRGYVVSSR